MTKENFFLLLGAMMTENRFHGANVVYLDGPIGNHRSSFLLIETDYVWSFSHITCSEDIFKKNEQDYHGCHMSHIDPYALLKRVIGIMERSIELYEAGLYHFGREL